MQCVYIHHLGSSDPVQHQQKGLSHSFQFHQQICSKLQGHLQSNTSCRKEKLRSQKIITNYQPTERSDFPYTKFEAIQACQLVKESETGQKVKMAK